MLVASITAVCTPLSHLSEGLTEQANSAVCLEAPDNLSSLVLLAHVMLPHDDGVLEQTSDSSLLKVPNHPVGATF